MNTPSKVNYQKLLDEIIEKNTEAGITASLLLHSCCAPCSSYVLSYLSDFFSIIVFYYNPNIAPEEEYHHRLAEQKRLIDTMMFKNPVAFIEPEYDVKEYYDAVSGLETEPEGGIRCEKCFRLRLQKTAEFASLIGCDFFGTTLTVSPHKNAPLINSIGEEISKNCGIEFLPSDFKKKDGYKQSILLSNKYELYRQNYCGCLFSLPKQ